MIYILTVNTTETRWYSGQDHPAEHPGFIRGCLVRRHPLSTGRAIGPMNCGCSILAHVCDMKRIARRCFMFPLPNFGCIHGSLIRYTFDGSRWNTHGPPRRMPRQLSMNASSRDILR